MSTFPLFACCMGAAGAHPRSQNGRYEGSPESFRLAEPLLVLACLLPLSLPPIAAANSERPGRRPRQCNPIEPLRPLKRGRYVAKNRSAHAINQAVSMSMSGLVWRATNDMSSIFYLYKRNKLQLFWYDKLRTKQYNGKEITSQRDSQP